MDFCRPAEARDFERIMALLAQARAAIARLGIDQWQDGYPEPEVIRADLSAGIGRVFEREGRIAGYFALQSGAESCYECIDGA